MNAILCGILAGVCWGVGELFTKSVLHTHQVGPMTVLLVRALVTVPPAIIVYLIAQYALKTEPQGWWRDASAGLLTKLCFGSALLAGFGGVFFFYLGLSLPGGDISRIKPIAFALAPAVAALLGWVVLGEPMSIRKGAGIVVILAGVVLITSSPASTSPSDKPPALEGGS